jgi:ferredoxin
MPTLTIEGQGPFEVDAGTRLVNAIRDAGVDIGHRCGGYARCTTCRVEISAGEPSRMTRAEQEKHQQAGLEDGVRLACQLLVEGDMTVRPLMLVSEQGWPDGGAEPAPEITPEPEWVEA